MLGPLHCCSGTAVELRTDWNAPEFAKKILVKHEHEAERCAGCQTQHNMKKPPHPPPSSQDLRLNYVSLLLKH